MGVFYCAVAADYDSLVLCHPEPSRRVAKRSWFDYAHHDKSNYMANKRIFKKFFTRSISLLTAQYWYLGECKGLDKLSEGAMHFEPLFVYTGKGGVSVYYEMNNPKTYLEPLIAYFRKKPEAFKPLVAEYQKNILEIENLAKESAVSSFSKIYNNIVSAWPMISVSVIVGRLIDDPEIKDIAKEAYDLRHSTDKIEYQAANILADLAKNMVPSYREEINFLTFEEIIKPEQIIDQEIKARQAGYIYYNGQVITGISLDDFIKKNDMEFQDEVATETVTELKGQSAQKGKISGKVKAILSLADINKVNEGDIIVAAMTTPDYLPALKKASGFITDEGGITCHAAIVARELKKPCIIGTKIATKVLHDGDMVEVDADKGIVKIIS